MSQPTICPCDTGKAYDACCGRFHAGRAASTAVELMRSRYSAYARKLAPYLLDTWADATRPPTVGFDPTIRWTGLEIIEQERGGLFDDTGTVTFGADHEANGLPQRLLEKSRFIREDGGWRYLAAEQARLDA
ncbi:YchJ family protein [Actinospongicola halichondriae]|uniref:YchJ family protein n=1 Tax=Actinospongicola halichondriae TaxID=3236844 RepID=UPI003D4990D8